MTTPASSAPGPTAGVLVITHGGAAEALVATVGWLIHPLLGVAALCVARDESFESVLARVHDACKRVDGGAGLVILVDLQGSSPYRAAMAMLDGARAVDVVCGVNLPMLMKLATLDRQVMRPGEVAEILRDAGKRSIRLGSELTGKVTLTPEGQDR